MPIRPKTEPVAVTFHRAEPTRPEPDGPEPGAIPVDPGTGRPYPRHLDSLFRQGRPVLVPVAGSMTGRMSPLAVRWVWAEDLELPPVTGRAHGRAAHRQWAEILTMAGLEVSDRLRAKVAAEVEAERAAPTRTTSIADRHPRVITAHREMFGRRDGSTDWERAVVDPLSPWQDGRP